MKIEDEIKEIQEKHKTETDQLERDKQAMIDRESDEVQVKKSNLTHKEGVLADKKRLETERVNLEKALALEKKERYTEVSDKEREKIRATENLKENMKEKIDETKANLKALNDEQLQTTTRLTILQNHQLTTELEYQSKQTEKLLNKNNKMQDQIGSLKRDIELHKEIESELAKKFHRSQKKIKKFNDDVKKMEDDLSEIKEKGKHSKQTSI
jgi:chromosome segregation ATPase